MDLPIGIRQQLVAFAKVAVIADKLLTRYLAEGSRTSVSVALCEELLAVLNDPRVQAAKQIIKESEFERQQPPR